MADGTKSTDASKNKAREPRALFAGLVLAAAAICFLLGVSLPIIKLERFYFFTDAHSLLSMVGGLFSEGELLLGLIILTFSVVLPAVKIAALGLLLARGADKARPAFIGGLVGAIGKWSMLDVLLVAVVIFAVRTSGVGTAFSQPGLYFFTAAVVLTTLAAALIRRAAATAPSRRRE